MRIKLIRLGSLITLYNGIYSILIGLFFILYSKFLISKYFERFPEVWEILVRRWVDRFSQYHLILIYTGFLLISFGIFIIYLSFILLKKRDKLSWVILFSGGLISWGSLFIVNILTKNFIIIILSFIGWASFIIGMMIPIKYYIRKEIPNF